MNKLVTNWQTSLAGLVVLLIGVLGAVAGVKVPGFSMDPGAAIALGLGLLAAKDGNVTGK